MMLTAQEYRQRSRKTITLPSGGEVAIRKLTGLDYLEVGDVPTAFWQAVKSGDKEEATKVLEKYKELSRRMTVFSLVRGVVSMKIVDKRPIDCAEDEVSVDEISPTDTDYIVEQISEMNALDKEAGKSIARFRGEHGISRDAGHDGEEVRKTADGDPIT
jgi:hypothetical protein